MATKMTVYKAIDGVLYESQQEAETADRVTHATTVLEEACTDTGKHWDTMGIEDIARALVKRGYYIVSGFAGSEA